ncbi:hypothetical protein BGM26_12715 [Bacillus sp. FJAT-29790]|nr:DUF6612 family protein [Bacillus sp. FJAT-29790]MBU8879852.1 hypothetical protein [Bacillus sp. FJAT-29790]
MKKTLSVLTGFLMIFMLAACNQTAKPVNQSDKETTAEKPSDLTLEEVLDKSTKASESLKGFSIKLDMTQNMSSDQEEQDLNTKSVIDMNIVTEPMAFYQKMTMSVEGSEEKFETESYFTEEGMFFFDAAGAQWMKFPKEMSDSLLQMSAQQTNPGEELKKLQKFVDDFTFKQDQKNYILKLEASGEKFNDFIKETAVGAMPPEMAQDELLNNMKINSMEYEILVDKETFYPVSLNMVIDMEITVENQTIVMKQKMHGQYSNHNKVEIISVPKEVIDTAVEMNI